MSAHNVIVVGASAGGVEALTRLVRGLPRNLPAAIFIVLHIPPHAPSFLPEILSRSGALEAIHPSDGMEFQHGRMYVAPPDQHILLEQGHIRVVRGPKENRHRPAVDPLFRSAALAYGPRVIGVILTGALDDGTAGLLAIKRRGGIAIVQNPKEALYPGMPQSALTHVKVDYTLPITAIAQLLKRLTLEEAANEELYPAPEEMENEVKMVQMDRNMQNNDDRVGSPSAYSCPECGGVLWELQDGTLLRFRCRVGHAFSLQSVFAEQSDTIEEALWVALKTLEEHISLSRRMAQQAHQRGQSWLASRFEQRLQETEKRVALIVSALRNSENFSTIDTQKVDEQT